MTAARPLPRPLGPRGESGPAPLSPMQQRLVFAQELQPEAPLHQLPTAFRLRGPPTVDAAVLERCLDELTRRHEVLRSRIAFAGELPSQVVDVDGTSALERIDLTGAPAGEAREAALRELLYRRANTPMSLTAGPLIQLAWIAMGPDDHVLFFMPHQIVWDGASLPIFLRELDALYAAFAAGRPSPLEPLPIQYADFAAWHAELVTSPAFDETKTFWRDRFLDARELPALDLPPDRPRPARMTYAGGTAWWNLDAADASALTELGRSAGATFEMVLVAGFAAVLQRYNQHREVLVGTTVHGRSWREIDGLIGMFVNTLVLRLGVNPDASFLDLLRTTKEICESSFDVPDMPLDLLVRELGLARDPSRAPLAQAFFSFQDRRDLPATLLGVPAIAIPLHTEFETQDLTLWANQTRDGVLGVLSYATDLFDRETVEALLDHYVRFLHGAVREPERPVGRIPIVGEEELAKLDAWSATRVPFPTAVCVHDLVAAQAKTAPDAIAVVEVGQPGVAGTARITYRELDERTNRLARHLRGLGVRRDARVGIATDRSIDLLVAQLGVLKAGGAYVPLDPSYPPERLAHMVEDSAMTVLVTQTALDANLPGDDVTRVRLDAPEDAAAIASQAGGRLEVDDASASPESLAYVIYTSGSTGKPKGVLVPHRPLVNFIESMKKTPGVGPSDVVLAVTTLSFDIAVFDTLTALAAGARVLMASREMTGDGELLRDVLPEHGVTLLNATPATWRLMIAAGWEGASEEPRFRAITAGEALPKDLAIELVDRCAEVWDLYGPTETTVWSTYWKAEAPVERVLIGRPIDNTEVHVLDGVGARCPIGVVGEIVIAGDGVTDGYLNRPELTTERFVADPFRDTPGARMYRTGDLGRWLRSGELEYLGRRDTQVKLRGFRIELGEIESVLLEHEAVAEAVASVSADDPQNPMLVAYVVSRDGGVWTPTELRKLVRAKLPPYMVPQHVVELTQMPLTPAGKVDRMRLPPPFGRVEVERVSIPPATEAELLVAQVCQELLRLERVGMGDNFFDVGGHSMLSLMLIARLEERTGVRLNPRVFLTSSLGQVAAMLPTRDDGGPRSSSRSPSTRPSPSTDRPPSTRPSWDSDEPPPSSLAGRLLARVGKKLFRR